MEKLLNEFGKLNLSNDKYAIYGSGPLAIRGIRKANDLDVIAKDDLYRDLKKELGEKEEGKISINNDEIEIYPTWNALADDPEGIIERAETIQGFKFATLEDIIKWKRKMNRNKDIRDIDLIKGYTSKKEASF
jgi:hypothetical protein